MRFFYLDRNWTDAVVEGVLSIGTFTSAERLQLEALREVIRAEVDETERTVRQPGGEDRLAGPGGAISGFLMRSRLVSGWPGLHVRAYRTDRQQDAQIIPESDPDRLKVLRMERLAPAVLLVLFDGVPAVVHVEEPRQGIQFGALRPDAEPLSPARELPLRDAATGADLPGQRVPVPFRRDSAGVIHMRKLRDRIAAVPATHVGGSSGLSVDANEFALEMLRFPFRQVFGDPANEPSQPLGDVFRPRVSFALLEQRFRCGDPAMSRPDEQATMSAVDPGELVFNARWAAATKLDLDASTIATWDRGLPRDTRLLVPIDVQALFVPEGGDEPMVRLPSALNAADGQGPGFPAPFTAGTPRPAGVHLQWAAPDALLRGRLDVTPDRNRLALPALPDRWVVLRLLTPAGATTVAVRGWVLEADRAVQIDLGDWPVGSAAAPPAGAPVAPADLTGAAGGAATWAVTYDSVEQRFALHDPLDDVAQVAPNGVAGDAATYVVAGWWSDASLDPLDAAKDANSLDALLHSLGWSAVTPWVDTPAYQRSLDDVALRRAAVNLTSANRFVLDPNDRPPPAPPVADPPVVEMTSQIRSTLADKAAAAFVAAPWWPHATLLHGSVYGVPIAPLDASLLVDNRPSADAVRVALGGHDDDVIGALAVGGFETTTDEARRDTERLLGAFTGQLLREIGAPDGPAAVEEHEHDIAFGSLPGGTRGDDRFLAGQSGAPLKIGRGWRAAAAKQTAGADAGCHRPGGDGGTAVQAVPREAGHDRRRRRRCCRERRRWERRPADQHRAAPRPPTGADVPVPVGPHGRGAGGLPQPAARR